MIAPTRERSRADNRVDAPERDRREGGGIRRPEKKDVDGARPAAAPPRGRHRYRPRHRALEALGLAGTPDGSRAPDEQPPAWLLRIAGALVRHPRTVLALWVILAAVTYPDASSLSSVLTKQGASKVVAGTASARVEDRLAKLFPQHSEAEDQLVVTAPNVLAPSARRLMASIDQRLSGPGRPDWVLRTTSAYSLLRDATVSYVTDLVRQVSGGTTGTAAQARLTAAIRDGRVPATLAVLARVALRGPPALTAAAGRAVVAADWATFPVPLPPGALSAFLSDTGTAALISVSSRGGDADADLAQLRSIVHAEMARAPSADVHVFVTGGLALVQDTYAKAQADNTRMELVAYGFIAVILILFFRALVPAGITVAAIGLALNVGLAALHGVGRTVTLTQFTVTIMTFVMLGAGVDYSMLLSSRYRQERLAGRSPQQAAIHATARAGESVLLAGTAVALAFSAALLSPVDWIPPLGFGGLVGIPIVLLAACTITPALLSLLGDRFFALGIGPLTDLEHGNGLARHLRRTAAVARRHKVAVVISFVVLTVPFGAVLATSTLTADPVALSANTEARHGADVIAQDWGVAALYPTVVLARPGRDSATPATAARLSGRLAAVPGVQRVLALDRPFGVALSGSTAVTGALAREYRAADGTLRFVVALRAPPFSKDARTTVAALIRLAETPPDGIRSIAVGGATRIDQQYDDAVRASFWRMILLVSVGVFVLLLWALRSLLIPVRLLLTIMISNIWAAGATVLIFQGLLHQPVINDLPVFLVVLMMGLGMDYEIFLVTRVRDLVRRRYSDEDATMTAVVDTGRVINAAGLVMAGSLGAMTLSSTLMLREYGVGLGLAVLLDATVIRMLLVPATLVLFRRYNWWLPRIAPVRQAARRRLAKVQAYHRDNPGRSALTLFVLLAAVRIAGAFDTGLMMASLVLTPAVLLALPRRQWRQIGLGRPGSWSVAARYLLLVVAAYAVVAAACQAVFGPGTDNWISGIPRIFDDLGLGERGLTVAAMVLAMGLLVPLAEEICYRGVLFSAAQRVCGTWTAIAVTSVGWAAVHLGDYGLRPLSGAIIAGVLPSVLLMGLALGYTRARTGSVLASVAAQGVANLALTAWAVHL